jgi:hypothetical protein
VTITLDDIEYDRGTWHFRRLDISAPYEMQSDPRYMVRMPEFDPDLVPENVPDGAVLMVMQSGLVDTYTGRPYNTLAFLPYNEETLADDVLKLIAMQEGHERCENYKVRKQTHYDPHASGNSWRGPKYD